MPCFQDVPVPILYQILTYIPDVATVCHLECTCRDFLSASRDFNLWQELHVRRWSFASAVHLQTKEEYGSRHQLDCDTSKRLRAMKGSTQFATEELLKPILKRGRNAIDICWKYLDEHRDPQEQELTHRVLFLLQRAAIWDNLLQDQVHHHRDDETSLEDYNIKLGLLCGDEVYRNYEHRAQDIRSQLDALAARVPSDLTDLAVKVKVLNRVLFEEQGFAGNAQDYYDYHNSLLDSALERKKAIPMTLAIVYKIVARRVGIHVDIVGLPGHIVVGVPALEQYIDVFHQGRVLHVPDLEAIVGSYGIQFQSIFLAPLQPSQVLRRVCNNLENQRGGNQDGAYFRSVMIRLMTSLLDGRNRTLLGEQVYNDLWDGWNAIPPYNNIIFF
jgi:regulator of sirC expression with transglutaminase-like and TPR domain